MASQEVAALLDGEQGTYEQVTPCTMRPNVKRFRGGLVFKAHRLCVSLNSRLESDKEEEEAEQVQP